MADVNFSCSPVPDCFQESERNADCFDDISAEAFDYPTADDFFSEKAAPIQDVAAQPLTSSNPSDVSSDGSGCVDLPSSEAGDEGGSLASIVCMDPDVLGSSVQFTCSGESVNGSAEELPDDAVASCTKQQFVLVRLDDNGRYMRTANEEDMRLLMKLLNASDNVRVHTEGHEVSVASEDDETLPARAVASMMAPSTSHSGGHRKPGGPCCHCGATESPQWRRGPAIKPVLCNACGTRFRRTNQLGVAIPSYLKDKSRGAANCKKRSQKESADTPETPAPPPKRPGSSRHNSSARSISGAALA